MRDPALLQHVAGLDVPPLWVWDTPVWSAEQEQAVVRDEGKPCASWRVLDASADAAVLRSPL
jgi:hypothetical protein